MQCAMNLSNLGPYASDTLLRKLLYPENFKVIMNILFSPENKANSSNA